MLFRSLSSRSLIRSSVSVILLLIPSCEFLSLFIVLFILICLLFSSSRSLLNVSCIFSLYFQDFGSSLVLLLLILFQVHCLFHFHLFVLVAFSLAQSSAAYFSVSSFCLTYCVWGLLFPGFMFVVPVTFGVCPQWVSSVQWLV